jgi:hypothetical protein
MIDAAIHGNEGQRNRVSRFHFLPDMPKSPFPHFTLLETRIPLRFLSRLPLVSYFPPMGAKRETKAGTGGGIVKAHAMHVLYRPTMNAAIRCEAQRFPAVLLNQNTTAL